MPAEITVLLAGSAEQQRQIIAALASLDSRVKPIQTIDRTDFEHKLTRPEIQVVLCLPDPYGLSTYELLQVSPHPVILVCDQVI